MKWQDIVIALCQFGFILAFIPTFRSNDKPPVSTCVMNAFLICIISFCLATLSLWLALITALALVVCWLVVAAQKIKIDKIRVANQKSASNEQK